MGEEQIVSGNSLGVGEITPEGKFANLISMVEALLSQATPEDIVRLIAEKVKEIFGTCKMIIYLENQRLPENKICWRGWDVTSTGRIETTVEKAYSRICSSSEVVIVGGPDIVKAEDDSISGLLLEARSTDESLRSLVCIPLQFKHQPLGFLALFFEEDKTSFNIHQQELFKSASLLFSSALNNTLEHQQRETQIQRLNTYYTISSMLNEILDLRELLGYVISISTDALSAEAGSVLLLDESRKQLEFYSAEGEKKEVLLKSKFAAHQGIAGWVIENRKLIVVNNLQQDPRFYRGIDERSGFQSRSMVAAPVIANEEILGVIEVLNKVDQSDFTSEEGHSLASIADEVAFAIKNSILFEYLVNFYCRRRQGLSDCKGCKKPLSSWTPCAMMWGQEQEQSDARHGASFSIASEEDLPREA